MTGANRGLGLEITTALAKAGAKVIMACRTPAKAGLAADDIRKAVPEADLEVTGLDVADLSSVRQFAAEFLERHARLDILCHNAAAITVPLGRTRDGFETHIGTNVFGPFALTALLLGRLNATPGARVVLASSIAHKLTPGMDLDDLHFATKPYKEMDAYGKSKFATLLFMFELDRRLRKSGSMTTVVAAHPGWSNTNPDRGSFLMRMANSLMAQPPAMGALPLLYAATAQDIRSTDFIGPGGFQQMRGYPARVECRSEARDPALAGSLWTLIEEATGIRFPA